MGIYSAALYPCADTEGTRSEDTSRNITNPLGSGHDATREAIQKCSRCVPIFMVVALSLSELHPARLRGSSANPRGERQQGQPVWFASGPVSQQSRASHRVRRY